MEPMSEGGPAEEKYGGAETDLEFDEPFTDPFVLQILHRSLVDGSKRWTFRVLFYTAIHSKSVAKKLRTSKESIQSVNSQSSASTMSTLSSASDDIGLSPVSDGTEDTDHICLCQRVPIAHRPHEGSREGPERSAGGRKSSARRSSPRSMSSRSMGQRSRDKILRWKPSSELTQDFLDAVSLWGRVLKTKYEWSVDRVGSSVRLSEKILCGNGLIEIHSELNPSNCTLAMLEEMDTVSQSNDNIRYSNGAGSNEPSIRDDDLGANGNLLIFGSILPVYSSDSNPYRFGPSSTDPMNGRSLNGHTCMGKVTQYALSNHEILINSKDGALLNAVNLNDANSFKHIHRNANRSKSADANLDGASDRDANLDSARAMITCKRSRDRSIEALAPKSPPRQLINLIHDYHKHITSTNKLPALFVSKLEWFNSSDKIWLKEHISLMCSIIKRAKDLFLSEPRLPSPVAVFGDIHGNLPDLIR